MTKLQLDSQTLYNKYNLKRKKNLKMIKLHKSPLNFLIDYICKANLDKFSKKYLFHKTLMIYFFEFEMYLIKHFQEFPFKSEKSN